jgi:group I intron endonuclease
MIVSQITGAPIFNSNLGIIYSYTNLINNKRYIGLTFNEKQRYKDHQKQVRKGTIGKFYNAVRKYGMNNFKYEVLFSSETVTLEELNQKEIQFIAAFDSFKNGYNATIGGDAPMKNRKHSPESIERMKGKTPSEETRLKLSMVQIGEKNHFFGAQHSTESKEKMKLKKIKYQPVLKFTLSGEFIEEFDSLYNAAKSINDKAKASNIKICCLGKDKQTYKFILKFKQ